MEITRTGIVRKFDSLGRLILPKEIRNRFGFEVGISAEILLIDEGVLIKKFDFFNDSKYKTLQKLAIKTNGCIYLQKNIETYIKFNSDGITEITIRKDDFEKMKYTVKDTVKDKNYGETLIILEKKGYNDFDLELLEYTINLLEE